MKKAHRSEVEADGTAWTVEASLVDGHLKVEVLGACKSDGTIGLQLKVDGSQSHLAMLQDVVRELESALFGVPRGGRPSSNRFASMRQELPRAYLPWTEADEKVLLERWDAGDTVELLAQALGRGAGGVRSRLIKLGRIEQTG